jgi:hypothetical protein
MMLLKRTLLVMGIMAVMVPVAVNCAKVGRTRLIPEKKFIDLLVDIHVADALSDRNPRDTIVEVLDSASLYGAVFRKHAVTQGEFDTTMVYYSAHPEDFRKLYDVVLARLKMMEEEEKNRDKGQQGTRDEEEGTREE